MASKLKAALVLVLLWPGQQAFAQDPAQPEIVVTGTGTATYVPDRATVVIEVRTEAPTPAEAGSRNVPVMAAVLAALRQLGHPERAIRTTGYTVQPLFRYEPSGPTQTGYVAQNAITLRLDSAALLGRTLDAALAAGATRVGSVRFESSEHETLRRQALDRAVAAARQDAEVLARAAGGVLGPLISLSTNVTPTREIMSIAAAPTYSRTGEVPINAGEQSVAATVQGRWHFIKQ